MTTPCSPSVQANCPCLDCQRLGCRYGVYVGPPLPPANGEMWPDSNVRPTAEITRLVPVVGTVNAVEPPCDVEPADG